MRRPNERHVTIIGAGVVGVCSALWLIRDGWTVTIIDRLPPGSGASFGNAGNISPGAVVPFSMPGALGMVPKWLLDPSGPLRVRAAHLFKLLPWLVRWTKASREAEVARISLAMGALHGPTFDAYSQLTRNTHAEHLIERTGQIYVSRRLGAAAGSRLSQDLRAAAGVAAEVLGPDEIREMEPALAAGFQSGLFLPDNGRCLDPHRLVSTLAEIAVRSGARILSGDVIGFAVQDGRVKGVVLKGDQEIPVSNLVIAAGIGSGELLNRIGVKVPLQAERGYHVTMPEAGINLKRPVTNIDGHFVAQSMEVGLRIAGTVEFAAPDAKPNWARAKLLRMQAAEMFPGLRDGGMTRWCGSRPSLPDGLPVLDKLGMFPNIHLAFGNSHYGMTAGPVMGRAVADMLSGRPTGLPLQNYSLQRFH